MSLYHWLADSWDLSLSISNLKNDKIVLEDIEEYLRYQYKDVFLRDFKRICLINQILM